MNLLIYPSLHDREFVPMPIGSKSLIIIFPPRLEPSYRAGVKSSPETISIGIIYKPCIVDIRGGNTFAWFEEFDYHFPS